MTASSVQSSEATKSRPLWSFIWDTFDKSPEERRFLHRLDTIVLTYAALSYFSKNLNQQNITNAYVSGMQEDLQLHGNELNYIVTAWTCGYVLGQIPSNLLITRIRPSIWIPTMELIWSALTMVLATSKSFTHVIVLRFFIGLAESTFYPAMQYVVGSWYKPEELGKRSCIWHTASAIGPMFSGFLQAAAYSGLNGVHGLPGWKWLFIIDGIITVPIALIGYLVMPDLPHNTRPSFLYTAEQIELGKKRMQDIGRQTTPTKFTKTKVLGFFKTWHIWTLVPLYTLFNNSMIGPYVSMIFWFKSFNTPERTVYTIAQINLYPLGQNAVQLVFTLIWAWWSDAIRKRWPPIMVSGVICMTTCFVLAFTPLYTNIATRWAFYYLVTVIGGCSGLILAWANELTSYDNEKRSFIIAACNAFASSVQAWLPIVLWPQVEQPRIFKGTLGSAGLVFGMMCFAMLTLYLEKRDEKRESRQRLAAQGADVDTEKDEVSSIAKA